MRKNTTSGRKEKPEMSQLICIKVSTSQLELHSRANRNLYQALAYHIAQRQDATCYSVQIQSSDWLDQTLLRFPP